MMGKFAAVLGPLLMGDDGRVADRQFRARRSCRCALLFAGGAIVLDARNALKRYVRAAEPA